MQKKNNKIIVSDDVREFIISCNCMSLASEKYKSISTMYWDNRKYIATEDPNIFEVIFEEDINFEFLNNRRRLEDEENNI